MTAIIAATRFGPMLVPPEDQYVGRSLVRFGQFSAAEFATWIPYLPEGGVVVDAGANLGAHSLAFAAVVGPGGVVFAVEPQRALHEMLSGSIQLCSARNVRPIHRAFSREPGTVRVPLFDYGSAQNFGMFSPRDVPADAPPELIEHVVSIPLDSWKLERLDFLKIDVEGAELDVLHGAKETVAHCRPVIAVEADREQNNPALLAWLRLNGYRAWWHKPPLGSLWPNVISINLLALPREREELPAPQGFIDGVAIE